MLRFVYLLFFLAYIPGVSAQFVFELRVDYARQVGNTDQFTLSGTILSGRIEKGKTYFLEDGTKLVINNIISSKTATSVPVASMNENVSLSLNVSNFLPDHGDVLRGITTSPTRGGGLTQFHANRLPDGILSCRVNGKKYQARLVSKPVLIRSANILDLFFVAEDESVVWLQINGFSDIVDMPYKATSDTSQKEMAKLCKVAYMPKGYKPTDLPNYYKAYEDQRGNAGIMITNINRYKKTITLEFSGILRPNERLLQDGNGGGLFYINEGRVDSASWDEF